MSQLGGVLKVDSDPTRGTRLRIDLPLPKRWVRRAEYMKKLRILLADDHIVMRTGLRALLERQANLEVVGESEWAPNRGAGRFTPARCGGYGRGNACPQRH